MSTRYTVHLDIELSREEIFKLRQNSIERVFNNAIEVGTDGEKELSGLAAERASTLWQDAEDLKELVDKLWRTAQNETFNLQVE